MRNLECVTSLSNADFLSLPDEDRAVPQPREKEALLNTEHNLTLQLTACTRARRRLGTRRRRRPTVPPSVDVPADQPGLRPIKM